MCQCAVLCVIRVLFVMSLKGFVVMIRQGAVSTDAVVHTALTAGQLTPLLLMCLSCFLSSTRDGEMEYTFTMSRALVVLLQRLKQGRLFTLYAIYLS